MGRKPKSPVPEEEKDSLYYIRRKRNTECARKSRMRRKIIEEEKKKRLQFLENERIKFLDLEKMRVSKILSLEKEIASLKEKCSRLEKSLSLESIELDYDFFHF
jgi:hypothetical protein